MIRPKLINSGFTLIELLVVIAIIVILMSLLVPALERARDHAYVVKCASNLRQVGQAIAAYCNENRGEYPRALYVPGAVPTAGTGTSSPNPFAPDAMGPNDVTAAPFLLMRTQRLPPEVFICPLNDDTSYQPDTAAGVLLRSNFADYHRNLAYSFANPYPDATARAAGYQLNSHLTAQFPIAADLNPGPDRRNSRNHEGEGQNVLFADSHVDWQTSPTCGIGQDNIYTTKSGQVMSSPVDASDTVLLPAGQ